MPSGGRAIISEPSREEPEVAPSFLTGGGALGALMREMDWSTSPVGPPSRWPEALKLTVAMLLRAEVQIVLFWGPELVALYNDAYAPSIGDKHPRALGRPAQESWTELWDDLEPLLRGVLETGETFYARDRPFYIERRGYGETVYFDVSYSAVPLADSAVGGVLCIVSETTERVLAERTREALRQAEAEVEASRAEYLSALESTTDSIFVLSPDWRFTYLNRNAVEQIAEGRDLLGQIIWRAFPDAVGGALYTAYQRCMRDRVQTEAEQHYAPLGRTFLARAFPTDSGGVTVYFRDVTEERLAAARLAETESMLRAMGAASPDLLFAKDREGRMLYANPAALGVIGKPEAQVIGADETAWLDDPEQARTIAENDRRIIEGGQSLTIEERVTDARIGEVRVFQSTKSPLRDPESGAVIGLVGVSRDVTEQRAAQEALNRLNEELEAKVAAALEAQQAVQNRLSQAEKLTALGQLAGGVAHDFNNVMQAVLSAASLIKRRAVDPQTVTRLAGMVEDAATRGASLTRRLLAFARRGELRAELVDPAALLESLREVLGHTLGSEITIALRIEPHLPPVLADRGQLEAALINLATNGRDAMAGGGELVLSVARERRVDSGEVGDVPPGDYVRFAVRDTGTGIPPEVLKRVMEPFFTTKPQDKGTGLGLPMARSFAEQSGGSLSIESEVGRGTTVRMWLPVASNEDDAMVFAAETDALRARLRRRVLVVDDEYLVREILSEQLTEAGLEVVQAEDAATGLALLEAGEPFDLLITDRSMPGMDGMQLIEAVNRLRPTLPTILLTGFAGEADETAAGVYAVLRKPVAGAALIERIERLLPRDA